MATLVRLSATMEECATTGPVSAHPFTLDMTAATQSLTYQVSRVSFHSMLSFARSVWYVSELTAHMQLVSATTHLRVPTGLWGGA